MRRAPVLFLAVALCASIAPAAGAAVRKRPPAPKPVAVTYYFHGSNSNGNVDQNPVNGALMAMNATKPTGSSAKEFAILGYGGGPNTQCAGNSLFANWVGAAAGNIVGKATVTFWARSTPNATAQVRIFGDTAGQACNADYPAPMGDVTVPLAASPTPVQVTVTVPILGKGKVSSGINVEISPGAGTAGLVGPQLSGISYDATSALSSITFSCLPKPGKKTC